MSVSILRVHAPATIKLTRTMLEKHIIDANESIRNFAKLLGVDFTSLNAGDRIVKDAVFTDGTSASVCFYRTKNRGDRRLSIRGLKSRADIGDTIALSFTSNDAGEIVLVVNVTVEPAYKSVLGIDS